jgi:hypothetical protein
MRILLEQTDGAQDHSRRAPAALHGVGLNEGLLHGMQAAVRREAFDGDDALAGDGADLGEAGAGGDAIDENRACGALAFAAPVLGAGEVEVVAEDAEERPVGVGVDAPLGPVYIELGDSGHTALIFTLYRAWLPDFSTVGLPTLKRNALPGTAAAISQENDPGGHQYNRHFEALCEFYDDVLLGGGDRTDTLNVGGRYEFRKGLLLLFMGGHSLGRIGGQAPSYIGYFGLQIQITHGPKKRRGLRGQPGNP